MTATLPFVLSVLSVVPTLSTLRPNPLWSELPLFCRSGRFFQHALGTSVGSLSPRTNWSSLASFEFDLPPLDQQRRIAEMLWSLDQDKQSAARICKSVGKLCHSS